MNPFKKPIIRLICYTIGVTIILNSLRFFFHSFDELLFSFFTLTLLIVLLIPIFIYAKFKDVDEKFISRFLFVRFGFALILSLISAYIYPVFDTIDLRSNFVKVKGISVDFDQTDYETGRDCIYCDETETEVSYTTKIFNYAMDKSTPLEGLTLPDGVTIEKKGNRYGVYNEFESEYYDSIYSCYDCDFELGEFLQIREKPLTSFGMAYLEGYKILPNSIHDGYGLNHRKNYEYTYDSRIGFATLGLSFLWDLFLKEIIYNIVFILIFLYSLKLFKLKNV